MDIVIFQLGTRRCAVDLRLVQAVIPLGPITPVPTAPPVVAGAVNVRGDVVAVLDAGLLLGDQPVVPRQRGLGLLVQAEGCRVVLSVARVEEVAAIEPPPGDPERVAQPVDGPSGPLLFLELEAALRRVLAEMAAGAGVPPPGEVEEANQNGDEA